MQIERLGRDFRARRLAFGGSNVAFGQGRGRQAEAIARFHREIRQLDLVPIRAEGGFAIRHLRRQLFLCRNAPADRQQVERRDMLAQLRLHIRQTHIGRKAGQARVIQAQPGAQGALALA